MTTYILGDYHGSSIEEFREAESPTSNDRILSTGDFDQVSVIHEFLGLKDQIGEESVVDVGGNHDHALLEREPIASGTTELQSKCFAEMIDKLHEDPEAKAYLEDVVENSVKEFKIGGLDGVLVHGGLAGHIQSSNISEEMKPFWYRLYDEEHYEQNFDIMDQKEYDLLVRGHDHRRNHVFRPKDAYKPTYRTPDIGEIYSLEQGYRHIINHGPWFEGQYAAIYEDDLEIEFRQV